MTPKQYHAHEIKQGPHDSSRIFYDALEVMEWLQARMDATEENNLHVCVDSLLDELEKGSNL